MLISLLGSLALLYLLIMREHLFAKIAAVGLFVLSVYLIGGLTLKVLAAIWLPLLLVTGAYFAVFNDQRGPIMLITKFTGVINFFAELLKVIVMGAGVYYLVFAAAWWFLGVNFLGITFLSAGSVQIVMFTTLAIYLAWASWAAYKAFKDPTSRYNTWRRAYEARKAPKHLK